MPSKKKKSRTATSAMSSTRAQATPTSAVPRAAPLAWWRRKSWIAIAAFCSTAAAIVQFFYQPAMDYMDGKFGGGLELTINDAYLNREIPTYVLFPAGDAKWSDRYLIPVGLALRNDAPVKAADVTLSVRFDKEANRAAMAEFVGRYSGPRLAKDLVNETNGNDRHDFAVHRMNFLAPKEEFNLSEGGTSRSIPMTIEPIEPLLFSAHQGMDLHVTALSDRDGEQAWDLRYRALAVRDLDQIREVIEKYYAKQVALDIRRGMGTWNYFWRILFGNEISIIAYAPQFHYFPALALHIPDRVPKDHLMYRFDPYKMSLLFHKPAE